MSEVNKCLSWGVGDSGWAGGRAGGGEALKRFFTVRKKKKK